MRERLDNFLYSVENEYMDFFHNNRSEGIMELKFENAIYTLIISKGKYFKAI
jgi:hypothetical protein